ncbi:MAG TPA: hypothetical protein VGS58_19200, partial [Candidatus Sulfopaludibacter sp.]|nr:hypothetical protein [Candidatus Sulfopaludibacter sp.]
TKTVGDSGPRVFESFRARWEVFHEDGSPPNPDFHAYDTAAHNACRATAGFGDLVLASSSGLDEIGQAGPGELVGPLVAQNGRFLRYATYYNQAEFDYIVQNKLYRRDALPEVPSPRPVTPVLRFPEGSIAIKASWIDLTGIAAEERQRYYTRAAIVRDPAGGRCSRVTVGLAGLHIVQKTPSRPQWIWASFEQVDVVPPARMNAPEKFLLHDGKAAAMPAENPLPLVPLPRQAKPFNVERSNSAPIHPHTALANLKYERLLKDTVWANYQLVVTQWPRLDGDQSVPVPATRNGDVSNTFPGLGATSAFANVTMETFDQGRPQLGCMNCHNQARMAGDFMWSVLDHAYPAKLAPAAGAVRR